jgi:hypothetical protein
MREGAGPAVITTTKLTPTVGAEVTDVDVERLLHDEALPAALLDALEEHGVLATILSAHGIRLVP